MHAYCATKEYRQRLDEDAPKFVDLTQGLATVLLDRHWDICLPWRARSCANCSTAGLSART
jgi:hypothetical protein